MEDEVVEIKEEVKRACIHTYPLVRHTDMNEDMASESVEIIVTACEKFSDNNELAAKMIKEQMDKKFNPSFHAIVGEGFGFEITYQTDNLLFMYFGGNLAICVWKIGAKEKVLIVSRPNDEEWLYSTHNRLLKTKNR